MCLEAGLLVIRESVIVTVKDNFYKACVFSSAHLLPDFLPRGRHGPVFRTPKVQLMNQGCYWASLQSRGWGLRSGVWVLPLKRPHQEVFTQQERWLSHGLIRGDPSPILPRTIYASLSPRPCAIGAELHTSSPVEQLGTQERSHGPAYPCMSGPNDGCCLTS